jgi:RNA-directed DNA polymerase
MKESYRKEVANHPDPESCTSIREGTSEALTGAYAGVATELRNHPDSGADAVIRSGRQNRSVRQREHALDPAQSTTHYMHENSLRKNWEGSLSTADGTAVRVDKGKSQRSTMDDDEHSDIFIVPTKHLNKVSDVLTAEGVEERKMTKGNSEQPHACRTQCRESVTLGLDRVRRKAKADKGMKFTALLHHVTPERLIEAFGLLKRNAATGIDEVTWKSYAEHLKGNIEKLHKEVQCGSYRAKPSRRVFILKSDGGKRPLGIAALEDKIVQKAVTQVLNAIYEEDFLGFSYGFRPGRSQHQALDALATGIITKKVNYVLDADIRGYFDAMVHGWLVQFVEHRIGDRRIVPNCKKIGHQLRKHRPPVAER